MYILYYIYVHRWLYTKTVLYYFINNNSKSKIFYSIDGWILWNVCILHLWIDWNNLTDVNSKSKISLKFLVRHFHRSLRSASFPVDLSYIFSNVNLACQNSNRDQQLMGCTNNVLQQNEVEYILWYWEVQLAEKCPITEAKSYSYGLITVCF